MTTRATYAPIAPAGWLAPLSASDRPAKTARRILIAGAKGLVGSALAAAFVKQGDQVERLVRHAPGDGEVGWDPDGGAIDQARLERFDAVVHVASLPQARWTPAFIQRWRANHTGTNRLLASALAGCEHKPSVLVCASAQGVYPPSGDQWLTEDSPPGNDFLAQLLLEGEQAAALASEAGIRVVHLRLPTVLSGPALRGQARGLRRLGSGRQWFSWVARDELPSILEHVLATQTLEGPVNATSPNPARNAEFFMMLGNVLGRRPLWLVPAFMLRLMLGPMAGALLLASRRIKPRRLLEAGYRFHFPGLENALPHELRATA